MVLADSKHLGALLIALVTWYDSIASVKIPDL